jgi:hypothetical protein
MRMRRHVALFAIREDPRQREVRHILDPTYVEIFPPKSKAASAARRPPTDRPINSNNNTNTNLFHFQHSASTSFIIFPRHNHRSP